MTASGASRAEFQTQAYICPVCLDDHQPSPCWKETADLARQLTEARELIRHLLDHYHTKDHPCAPGTCVVGRDAEKFLRGKA